MLKPQEKQIPLETAQCVVFLIPSFFKGWFCWVFNREPQDRRRSYLLSTVFSPFSKGKADLGNWHCPCPDGSQQLALATGSSHSRLLAAGPLPFPQQCRPGHWKRENVRALPCQRLLATLTWLLWLRLPGLQPGSRGSTASTASLFQLSCWLGPGLHTVALTSPALRHEDRGWQ